MVVQTASGHQLLIYVFYDRCKYSIYITFKYGLGNLILLQSKSDNNNSNNNNYNNNKIDITKNKMMRVKRKMPNWKAPGPDNVQGF